MITTLRDAPHQHKSRFGHKVLATSTTCDQSKSECSIIDQRSNIMGSGHDVKKSTASVQEITPETHHLSSIPKRTSTREASDPKRDIRTDMTPSIPKWTTWHAPRLERQSRSKNRHSTSKPASNVTLTFDWRFGSYKGMKRD